MAVVDLEILKSNISHYLVVYHFLFIMEENYESVPNHVHANLPSILKGHPDMS